MALMYIQMLKWIFLLACIPCISSQGAQHIYCHQQLSSCICETDKGKIDLTPLASNDPNTPAFQDVPASSGVDMFSWNPCNNFIEASCVQVASCQIRGGGVFIHYDLGPQESAQFSTDAIKGLQLQYSADSLSNTLRTSYVQLICNPNEEKKFTASGEQPIGSAQYYMSIESKHCCPKGGPAPPAPAPGTGGGISIGTVLCIIFAVLLLGYIVGGIVFMKYRRGATGTEMIPNHTFWKDLPLLVKDGGRFVVTKVKGKGAYDQI